MAGVSEKELKWIKGLTETKKTLKDIYGPDVANEIIELGIQDPNLTPIQLRNMASKHQTPRQKEIEKDWLLTDTAIAGGDSTLNSNTFATRWLQPDSLDVYSKRDLNLVESRHHDLQVKELNNLKAQSAIEREELKISKEQHENDKKMINNLIDQSAFETNMNIGIFNELEYGLQSLSRDIVAQKDNLPRGEYGEEKGLIEKIGDFVSSGGNEELEERDDGEGVNMEELTKVTEDGRTIVKEEYREPDMEKDNVAVLVKPTEYLNKMKQNIKEYVNLLGSQTGNYNLEDFSKIQDQLTQSQAAFLKNLDEFTQSLPADPKMKHRFSAQGENFPGIYISGKQQETDQEFRTRVYNEWKKKYQQYLNKLKLNYDIEPGEETEEKKNPFEQYKRPS